MMRLDEFSGAVNMDGVLSSTEMTQFLLLGFNVPIISAGDLSTWRENIAFDSPLTMAVAFDSPVTTSVPFDSQVTTHISFDSLVTTAIDFDSNLGD